MANFNFTLAAPEGQSWRDLSMRPAAHNPYADRVTLSVHRDMAELEADWRALDANNLNSLHQSFDWCAAWKRAHDSQLLVVRGAIAEQLLFLLPFEVERGQFFRTARLIATGHSNLNTGLFAAEIERVPRDDLVRSLSEGVRQALRAHADVVAFERTPAVWRGLPHPLAALPGIANPNASFQLGLAGDMERTLAQLNAKRRRKKMRLSERRLAEIGGYDYVVAREAAEAQALLETFFRQKAARLEAQGLPDVFDEPETRAFFRLLIDRHRAGDRLLELNAIRLKGEHEGRIIAVTGLSRKGDHVICQFGSIDDTIAADSSPGELLFYRVIERLCGEGVVLFDFGIGDQPYKRSWCTIETVLRDITLPLTLRGHAAAGLHRAAVRAKRAIKANKALYALVQRQRRRLRTTTEIAAD
ncbi:MULTISPECIES: GNAT family N-acetyltransferase [Sinorhizobium]|uniref:Cellulose biosynthesis protein CelD n=2 Tax=Sinorhizobium TaxID=28105 RepID=A0A2S3YGS0_9HYPH|nr:MULTISPECIES: GNAT family N-acetyltransferase [Sinorhizobium]AUX75875.1 N-acetyltransferase family protein [Sinorhizobium fredii]PDT40340.1 cellulose biosynthesis protein CelD [Sinorhizobium sp. FG01]PDT52550.1 cellulose biosynthesis protein CelD [Sinorhizobium sp. NG07B]POH25574.1 cellulose biosynthesis protein CelD [Sinorhizobium americanum]POH28276.1 cellulose biosynthesis protein CelD [Sinorhizobium americanum]